MKENNIDRRAFLGGAVALTTVGGLSLIGCSSPQANADTQASGVVASGAVSGAAAPVESAPVTEWVDAITSASVATNAYTNLTDQKLVDTINSFQAACTCATVNEDGTPNLAVFAGGACLKSEYLAFNWTDNQTKANLKRDKLGMISFDVLNLRAESKPERHQGAKLRVEYIEDAALKEELAKESEAVVEGTILVKIVEVLPLG